MVRSHTFLTAIGAVAALALTVTPLAACGGSSSAGASSSSQDSSKISVVASISQWGSFAEKIGGDDVSVTNIVSSTSSTDSHEYEPTATDVSALTDAQVAIVNGAGYDTWATDALENDSDTTIINVATITNTSDGANPHLWFSKDARDKTAQAVHDALVKADPAHQSDYDKNLTAWQSAETKLDTSMAEVKEQVSGDTYVATESVAQYLLDDLGMVDKTPAGYKNAMANESEPSAQDVDEITKLITSKSVDALVVNDQESNTTTENLVTAANNAKIAVFHVTESMPAETTNVLDWMNYLANSLMLIVPTSGSASASASASATASASASDSSSASSSN